MAATNVKFFSSVALAVSHGFSDERVQSPTWAVFSGGLGTMDFRTATSDELKHRSAFTGFPSRARSATLGATPHYQTQHFQPLFQQFIMWKCAP